MQVWALSAKALSFLNKGLVLLQPIGVVISLHAGVLQCRVKLGITIKTGGS